MAKVNARPTKKNVEYSEEEFGTIVNKILPSKFRLKCKNEAQKEYSKLITEKEISVAAGPSGTGKSFIAIGRAIELLQNSTNTYKRIIISKPAVEAEEKLGFAPGTIREKLEEHLASSLDIVDKIMGKANRLRLEENEYLLIQPLGFIRGKTLDNAIIIIEEAQNLSPSQCKTILSRIGENSKMIISGDLDQSDRYNDVRESGLYDLFKRHRNLEEIGFYEFQLSDIVRNPLITKLLGNYPKQGIPDLSDIKSDVEYNIIGQVEPVKVVIPLKPKREIKPEIREKEVKLSTANRIKKFLFEKFTW
jgi:phosphate starvation-inducible protein PhoH